MENGFWLIWLKYCIEVAYNLLIKTINEQNLKIKLPTLYNSLNLQKLNLQ